MSRAAILTRLDNPLKVADVGLLPLQYGQVRVRILASGICGAQLAEIRGDKGNGGHLPHLLGHEGCGIVEEIGPAVTRVAVGDKVVMHWRKGDGIESDFPRYIYDGNTITSGKVVTFATEAVASENRTTKVEPDTPRELCALLGCGLSTALGTIENEAELKFGESILIVGVGGLGANLILAASLRGAGVIAATDCERGKMALAGNMGAHYFWAPPPDSHYSFVPGITDIPGSYDVIIDSAGMGDSMADTLPKLKSGGRYVMVGQQRPGVDVAIRNAKHMFDGEGKSIRATQGGMFNPTRDVPRYVQLFKNGLLKLDQLITHRIALDDINSGIDLVRKGQAGRVLIEMP
jgi:S-(hydroxymethyl)glutathione dehydrogenase/alcohol dehydrogenase